MLLVINWGIVEENVRKGLLELEGLACYGHVKIRKIYIAVPFVGLLEYEWG